jgi:hypothetical protein
VHACRFIEGPDHTGELTLEEIIVMSEEIKETKSFTQEELNHLLAEERRRAEEKVRAAEIERDNVKAEALRRQGAQTTDQFVTAETAQATRDTERRAVVGKYFGKGSSGREANNLMKSNPEMYRSLKLEAANLGLIPRIVEAPPKRGARTFSPTA